MEKPVNGNTDPVSGFPWKQDLLASFVVFLVALPLCLGIAIASGAPPMAGILSGIIGGLVVGALGGNPMQVSGPANGLIVVVGLIITEYGFGVLGAVVMLAGALQLLAGLFGLGQWFRAVPPATVLGLMTGFAVIIFASQFHVMLDDVPQPTPLANLLSIPEAIWDAIFLSGSHRAAGIGILTISVLLLWKHVAPHALRGVPASLVAVGAGVIGAQFIAVDRVEVDLSNAGHLIEMGALFQLGNWRLLELALTIAFLASTESLLSAAAVDQMHKGPRTQYDRELAAQGVGNMLCGLVGALPLTGVVIRSTANLAAGAKTRLSSVLHGFWLLAIVLCAPSVLTLIPRASLAAILVVAVFRLVSPTAIRRLWQKDKFDVVIYGFTASGIVLIGVLPGVLLGVGLCVAKLLYNFSHLEVRLEQDVAERRATLHLKGAATFLRLPALATALERVAEGTELHVHVDELTFIDHACLDLLMNWEQQQTNGGVLIINWEQLATRVHADRGRENPDAQQDSLAA